LNQYSMTPAEQQRISAGASEKIMSCIPVRWQELEVEIIE
jgi:hypothetical protein